MKLTRPECPINILVDPRTFYDNFGIKATATKLVETKKKNYVNNKI